MNAIQFVPKFLRQFEKLFTQNETSLLYII